jgi:hypothetical protein
MNKNMKIIYKIKVNINLINLKILIIKCHFRKIYNKMDPHFIITMPWNINKNLFKNIGFYLKLYIKIIFI